MSNRMPLEELGVGWQTADDLQADSFYGGHASDEHGLAAPPLGEVIRGRIRQRIGDRVCELDVAVEDESVVLRGSCATFYTKQLAQEAVRAAACDRKVINRIRVAESRP